MQKRIKEHKDDIKKRRVSMALARLSAKKRVKIDFQVTKKFANDENFNHALKRGAEDSRRAQSDQLYETCTGGAGLARNNKE